LENALRKWRERVGDRDAHSARDKSSGSRPVGLIRGVLRQGNPFARIPVSVSMAPPHRPAVIHSCSQGQPVEAYADMAAHVPVVDKPVEIVDSHGQLSALPEDRVGAA
jgi:hypothetical protein